MAEKKIFHKMRPYATYQIYRTLRQNIMEEHNHRHIDLLKIDIEGAEIEVLEQMLLDNIKPTYLLVEFDLYLKRKDSDNKETCPSSVKRSGITSFVASSASDSSVN